MIIYAVVGIDPALARFAMAFTVALAPVLLFQWMVQGLRQQKSLAFVTSLYLCLYPPAIYYAPKLITESLAHVLILVLLLIFYSFKHHPTWRNAAGVGIILGCLALTRPVFGFLPFYLGACHGLFLLMSKKETLIFIKYWGIVIGAYCLMMAPWTVRNYLIHDAFIPFTTSGGHVLFVCNSDLSHPDIQAGGYTYAQESEFLKQFPPLTEAERSKILSQEAIQRLLEKIEFLPNAVLHRALNFWTFRPDPFDKNWSRNDGVMAIVYLPILFLFGLSFFILPFQKYWPLYAVIFYAFVFVLPFWGAARFRFPVDALIVTIAFLTGNEALRRFFFSKGEKLTQQA